MPFIQERCGKQSDLLASKLEEAESKVRGGAVILGESHDKPYARAVICDFIDLVTKLFIEMGDLPLEDLGIQYTTITTVGQYLRARTGEDVRQDRVWTDFLWGINLLDRKWKNPIPFAEMIPFAVENGVRVYFFDNRPGEQTSSRDMRERNEVMGAEFKQNVPKPEPGVVVLIGGAHLEGTVEQTLQHQCGIGPDRLIDLSRME